MGPATILVALAAFGFVVVLPVAILLLQLRKLKRAEFIRTYHWPRGLLDQLEKHRPNLTRKETALVAQGLRQFFLVYQESGGAFVSMPSQVVDDLWHEFILYTREYQNFCRKAFGGFLHHMPAAAIAEFRPRSNEGLRRVWHYCCQFEGINVSKPTRLPLLFALDGKLKIEDGFFYHPQCEELRKSGEVVHCATDFSDRSLDGKLYGGHRNTDTTAGCGGGGGCGGDGGGCGSGCGGGH